MICDGYWMLSLALSDVCYAISYEQQICLSKMSFYDEISWQLFDWLPWSLALVQ